MTRPELVELRKDLHRNPELSNHELATANRIKEFILRHHPTILIENIGGSGLAAVYSFPNPGKTIVIRCELDALPIDETNTFEHRSKQDGVSHKCGHDGHMAIVAGLIFWLKNQSFSYGKVVLLFQPAEENGQGAQAVIKDPKFQSLQPNYVFALHNIPKMPMHQIIVTGKGFSAEVLSFVLKVKGKESHASQPENGINPALGIARLNLALATFNNADPSSEEFSILTPVHLLMGQKSYGISPANGELHYTIRSWTSQRMTALKKEIEDTVQEICIAHQLAWSIEWFEYFPASRNDAQCIAKVSRAAEENEFEISNQAYPFKFGEDFGWYSKQYKTAMFGLGSGIDTPALHSEEYDFPDEIIDTGISMFASIITQILAR